MKKSPTFDIDFTQMGVPPSVVARFVAPRESNYNVPHKRNN